MENKKTAMGDLSLERVKTAAKKRFNKDITDEQAKAWLDANGSKELSDEELDSVAGGCGWFSGWFKPKHDRQICPECGGKNLKQTREGNFWNNMCEDCGWHEGGVDY